MVDESTATNDNNDTTMTITATGMESSAPARQPLGAMSPNVGGRKLFSRPDKSMVSSPLKRSYLAAIGSDQGFKYLKRRRALSSTILQSTTDVEPQDTPIVFDEVASFRHAARETTEDLPPLVSSQAPCDDHDEADAEHGSQQDRDSSSEHHSFSSLINYDPSSQNAHTSQQSARYMTDTEIDTSRSTTAVTNRASRAEVLCLRLRIAMYKVETDQIHTPFDYLRERTANGLRESSRAVQEAVEQLRDEAREVLLKGHGHETVPVYASTELDAEESACVRLPSSPPANGPVALMRQVLTPKSRINGSTTTKDLTSSAVKSHVAEGLLGMRNALL